MPRHISEDEATERLLMNLIEDAIENVYDVFIDEGKPVDDWRKTRGFSKELRAQVLGEMNARGLDSTKNKKLAMRYIRQGNFEDQSVDWGY